MLPKKSKTSVKSSHGMSPFQLKWSSSGSNGSLLMNLVTLSQKQLSFWQKVKLMKMNSTSTLHHSQVCMGGAPLEEDRIVVTVKNLRLKDNVLSLEEVLGQQ